MWDADRHFRGTGKSKSGLRRILRGFVFLMYYGQNLNTDFDYPVED